MNPTFAVGGRRRLPNRRRNVTVKLIYGNRAYAVTVGFGEAGQPREIFVHGQLVGSDMDGLLDDACVGLSLLLQYGADPAALASSMGRLGDGVTPASIVGALADLIAAELDADAQPGPGQ